MILEYSNVLEILAEVSVTLGGFIGVILIFQRGDRGSWSRGERNTMFHLLYTSLGTLGLSLFPLLIQPGFSESIYVWRVCCPALGFVHATGAFRAVLEHRRAQIAMPIRAIYFLVSGSFVLVVLTIFVVFGYLAEFAALIYLVGLGWLLSVAVTSFASLLFRDAV